MKIYHSYKDKVKSEAWSIPNLMSYFRILLIPVFVYLYHQDMFGWSFAVIILSGITDIVDGKVARHYNMVTDWGKFVDPVADKLTQAAIIIMLSMTYKLMIPLILLFAIKEFYMLRLGFKNFEREGEVESSRWFGKLNTVLLYILMSILILLPPLPPLISTMMICTNAFFIILSWILYAKMYRHIRMELKESKNANR